MSAPPSTVAINCIPPHSTELMHSCHKLLLWPSSQVAAPRLLTAQAASLRLLAAQAAAPRLLTAQAAAPRLLTAQAAAHRLPC